MAFVDQVEDFQFNEKQKFELKSMFKDLLTVLLVKTVARKDLLSKH